MAKRKITFTESDSALWPTKVCIDLQRPRQKRRRTGGYNEIFIETERLKSPFGEDHAVEQF
jgi:hypothetical protein